MTDETVVGYYLDGSEVVYVSKNTSRNQFDYNVFILDEVRGESPWSVTWNTKSFRRDDGAKSTGFLTEEEAQTMVNNATPLTLADNVIELA